MMYATPGSKYTRSARAQGRTRRVYRKDNPAFVFRTDRASYDEVVAFAKDRGVSMSEAIRLLVEWGMEDARCSQQS
jgi:hypothetical protein